MAEIGIVAAVSAGRGKGGLDGLDLWVPPRSRLTLIGPDPAGPRAVLALLEGRLGLRSGQVLRDGRPDPAGGLRVAPGRLPRWQRAGRLLRRAAASEPGAEARLRALVELLHLGDVLPLRIGRLGAEARLRLALALAALRGPAVMLLDDPLEGVPPADRPRLRAVLVQLADRLGWTMCIACSDPADAMALGTEMAVIVAGQAVQQAAPAGLWQAPASREVAMLTGSLGMNLVAGHLSDGVFAAEHVRVEGLGGPDGPAILGFRPEAVWMPEEEIGYTGSEIEGIVQGRVFAGDAVCAVLRLSGQDLLLRCPPEMDPVRGQTIRAILAADACHLFDPGTGRRLG